MWGVIAVLALAGCGRIGFGSVADGGLDSVLDASPDSPPPATGPWSTPMPITGATTGLAEEDCTGNSTKTELIFGIAMPAGSGIGDLYVMTRPSPTDAWGARQPITELATSSNESSPRLSPDDLTLYFQSNRPGSLSSSQDVWQASRSAVGQPWGSPTQLLYVSSTDTDKWMTTCDDGHYLLVRALASNVGEIMAGITPGPPAPVTELNTAVDDNGTFVSPDCLSLYFSSDRNGSYDLFEAHRASVSAPWDPPVVISDLSTSANDETDPWISPDGRLFLFSSDAGGTPDLYMATR